MKTLRLLTALTLLGGCTVGVPAQTQTSTIPPTTSATATTEPIVPTAAPSPTLAPPLPGATLVDAISPDVLAGTVTIWPHESEVAFETDTQVVVLDGATATVVATLPLPDLPQINQILLSSDSLWVTDHDGGRVLRVDRESGQVVAEIDLPRGRAVSLLETEHGIWAGQAHGFPEGVSLIDPASNQITMQIGEGAFPAYGLGSLWFGKGKIGVGPGIRRVDPATGEIKGMIRTGGCYIGGRFPDAVWSHCLLESAETHAVRIDVETLEVVADIPLGGAGELVGVAGNRSWFSSWSTDDNIRLLAIDNASNEVVQEYSLPSTTMVAIHSDELWMLEQSGRLWRLPLVEA